MFDILQINYWASNLREIELYIGILTFIATLSLGAFVFFKNPRSWTNRFLLLLSLVFSAYIVANFFSLHTPAGHRQLFWIRMVMAIASLKTPLLFLLVHTFPDPQIKLRTRYVALILTMMGISFAMALSPFVFSSLNIINGEPIPSPGPGIALFLLNFVGFLFGSIAVLVNRVIRLTGKDRMQHLFLLYGIGTAFVFIAVTSLVFVVILQTSSFVFLGPVFLVFLLAPIAYAIVKHQLFDIKLIATNVFVIILLIVLLGKLFISQTVNEAIINAIIVVAIAFFGILLTRSVRREVAQREHLERLTSQLEATNAKLKELDKMKSEFLSFASHQVKAPMSVVKGYASLILDGTYGDASEQIKETARKIKNSADNLISLVENLLDLRKIEEGKIEYAFEPTNIAELVSKLTEELRPLAREKNIEVSLTVDDENECIAAVDVQKFRQVIQNLLDNAIKYTEKGWIKISTKHSNGYVTVTVADSGQGIPADVLPELFEQFGRGKEKTIKGTGLGLYIAKMIVSAHKGTIKGESPGEQKGSTFTVTIPRLRT